MEYSEIFFIIIYIFVGISQLILTLWLPFSIEQKRRIYRKELLHLVNARAHMYEEFPFFSSLAINYCANVLAYTRRGKVEKIFDFLSEGNWQEAYKMLYRCNRKAGIALMAHFAPRKAIEEIEKRGLSRATDKFTLLLALSLYDRLKEQSKIALVLKLLKFRFLNSAEKAVFLRAAVEHDLSECDIDNAFKKFRQAVTLFTHEHQWREIAEMNFVIAEIYEAIPSYDNAFFFYNDAEKYFKTCRYENGIACALSGKGSILTALNNNEAVSYYHESILLFKKIGNLRGQIRGLLRLAHYYIVIKNNYDLAKRYIAQAAKINKNDLYGTAASQADLRAYMAYRRGRYRNAVKKATEAVNLYNKQGNKAGVCNMKFLKAQSLNMLKEYEEADKLCRNILAECKNLAVYFTRGEVYTLRADMFIRRKNYADAYRCNKLSLKEETSRNNLHGVLIDCINLVQCCDKLGRKKDLIRYRNMAEKIHKKIKNKIQNVENDIK